MHRMHLWAVAKAHCSMLSGLSMPCPNRLISPWPSARLNRSFFSPQEKGEGVTYALTLRHDSSVFFSVIASVDFFFSSIKMCSVALFTKAKLDDAMRMTKIQSTSAFIEFKWTTKTSSFRKAYCSDGLGRLTWGRQKSKQKRPNNTIRLPKQNQPPIPRHNSTDKKIK